MSKKEASESLAASRYATCLACDRIFRPTKQCKECGCFLVLKVRVKNQSCPLGKW